MLLLQTGCEMEGFLILITTDGTLLNFQGITLFYSNTLKVRTLLFEFLLIHCAFLSHVILFYI